MGNKRLSKVLSFTDDKTPYDFIQIYAGVGSGKNFYIEQLIRGHTDKKHDGSQVEIEPQTVLLITSRRSKVDEMLTEKDLGVDGTVGRWDEFHIVVDDNGNRLNLWESCVYYRMIGELEMYTNEVLFVQMHL